MVLCRAVAQELGILFYSSFPLVDPRTSTEHTLVVLLKGKKTKRGNICNLTDTFHTAVPNQHGEALPTSLRPNTAKKRGAGQRRWGWGKAALTGT